MKKNKDEKIASLEVRIEGLEEEVAKLMDENQSLWDMLDEITASDIKNWTETLQKAHNEMKFDKLMVTKKIGDA